MTFIPFPEYRPDVDDMNGQHTQVLSGVLPRGDGYGPAQALQAYTQPLAAGNDTYTKLLLHCDGSDTSTTFTDSNAGGSVKTFTAAGNAQIDTAQYKFGGASALFDGTGDYVSASDHADFTLGSSDFTIDLWFRCNVAGGSLESICGQTNNTITAANSSFNIFRETTNLINCAVYSGSTPTVLASTTQFTNAVNTGWHHLAFIRSGNTLYLYIDGVLEDSDSFSGSVNNSSNNFAIGALGEYVSDPWTGWLDEIRISVGIARWTTTFTPPQKAYDSASNGANRGFCYARKTDGSISIFAATATRIFQLNNSTLDWIDVTKGGIAYSSVPTGGQWQFAQYGSNVVAVQANVAPQVFSLSGTEFANLGGSPPQASFVAVVGRFLVLSGLTSNPTRVFWSDLDDITVWTDGTGFSNRVDLPDGGVVRGVAGGEFGLVFQESVIRRMVYVPGAKPAFQMERITEEFGLLGGYSVVRSGGFIFWVSQRGFHQYHPATGIISVGKERVDRTFLADLDDGYLYLLIGAPDPASTRISWAYKSVGSSATTVFDKIITYDFELKRWAPPLSTSGEYLAPMVKPGMTLEGLDSISASIDALSFSLDSVQSALNPKLAAFDSSHQLGFFDGSNVEAVCETPEQSLDRRVRVRGIKPRTDATTVYGSIRHRANAQSVLTQTTETLINSKGVCPQNIDAQLSRGRIRIPSGTVWTNLMGVEPDFRQTGIR